LVAGGSGLLGFRVIDELTPDQVHATQASC
jgi:hypothetical protein